MHLLFKEKLNIYQKPTPITHPFKVTQVTIGDLHANIIKLIYFLIRNGIISMDDAVYSRLVDLYKANQSTWSESYLQELCTSLKSFVVINKHVLVRIIGDDVCDRGMLDLSLLWFLEEFVEQQGLVQIHVSNHGFEFITYYELNIHNRFDELKDTDVFSLYGRYQNVFSKSLSHLDFILKQGWIDWDTLQRLYESIYRPLLRVMTYSICPNTLETHLFSHAECGLETISCIGEHFGLADSPNPTIARIINTIEFINLQFQVRYANVNNICKLSASGSGFYHNILVDSPLNSLSAINHLVWRRANDPLPPLLTPEKLSFRPEGDVSCKPLGWFHGHCDLTKDTGHTFTLDSACGKSTPDELSTEDELYIDLVSDHVPISMLSYNEEAKKMLEEYLPLLTAQHKPTLVQLLDDLWNATFRLVTLTVTADLSCFTECAQVRKDLIPQITQLIVDSAKSNHGTLLDSISSRLNLPLRAAYARAASHSQPTATSELVSGRNQFLPAQSMDNPPHVKQIRQREEQQMLPSPH